MRPCFISIDYFLESISLHYVSPPSLAMPTDVTDCVAAAGISQVFIFRLKPLEDDLFAIS